MKLIINILFILYCGNCFSQDVLSQHLKQLQNTTDISIKKESVLHIIDHYLNVEENNDSIQKYLQTNILIEKDSLFYAELLYRNAILNNNLSKFDSSVKNAANAARLFDKYDQNYKKGLVKSLQGSVYQAMFKNQLALNSFDEAKNLLKGEDYIQLLTGYAAVYSQLNELDKSIEYYNLAYQASIQQKNETFLFNIYNGMAVVYYKNKNPEKSIESLKKALEAAEKKGFILGQVVCLHNLGHKYRTELQYVTAKSYFEKAIALIDKVDYKLIEGQIYYKYADCLLNLGEVDKAEIFANKSEVILNEMKSSGRLPFALKTKAAIQQQKGNIKQAIYILEEAILLSSQNEIRSITSDLYKVLAENYKITGNSSKTYEAFSNHIRIKDSLEARKNTAEIEKVKETFEASERENKLTQENRLLEAKNITSYYRNILLAVALVGLVFFIYRQRRITKATQKVLKQEKEIISLNEELLKDKVKHKDTQITEYAILIDERNKFMDGVKMQIKTIRDLSNNAVQKRKVNELQVYIKENIKVNKGKVDLDKNAFTSGNSFRFDLEHRFPKLTDKEIVLSKLLLLNLTSKEIAVKMDISVQSVNNYRSSIRKKVGLQSGGNLKRFLQKI